MTLTASLLAFALMGAIGIMLMLAAALYMVAI